MAHDDLGGYYARDAHRGGFGDDYARDDEWSGGGRHDDYVRERSGYSGLGPGNYRRADNRVLEDVCDALTEAGDVDATDVEVAVNDGTVTLSGRVGSKWEKRRAEDIALRCRGVLDVMNTLQAGPDFTNPP
ncbi:MAG TPA: BON domain-containing protein [Thermoanaerobaculia bacterium]|nr:BON domain-containing protein [Thermoanaerobaculia bacterium]